MDETDEARSATQALIRYLESSVNNGAFGECPPALLGPGASWSLPSMPASRSSSETPMAMIAPPLGPDRMRWQWRLAAFLVGIMLGAAAMWTVLVPPASAFAPARSSLRGSVATSRR